MNIIAWQYRMNNPESSEDGYILEEISENGARDLGIIDNEDDAIVICKAVNAYLNAP